MEERNMVQILTSFFNRLMKSEKGRAELERYNKIIQFYCTDGEDVFVKVENGIVSVLSGRVENPDLELRADTETYASVLSGKLTPGKAWWDQKLILGWVDRSKPYYPWFTRIINWFSCGSDKVD